MELILIVLLINLCILARANLPDNFHAKVKNTVVSNAKTSSTYRTTSLTACVLKGKKRETDFVQYKESGLVCQMLEVEDDQLEMKSKEGWILVDLRKKNVTITPAPAVFEDFHVTCINDDYVAGTMEIIPFTITAVPKDDSLTQSCGTILQDHLSNTTCHTEINDNSTQDARIDCFMTPMFEPVDIYKVIVHGYFEAESMNKIQMHVTYKSNTIGKHTLIGGCLYQEIIIDTAVTGVSFVGRRESEMGQMFFRSVKFYNGTSEL